MDTSKFQPKPNISAQAAKPGWLERHRGWSVAIILVCWGVMGYLIYTNYINRPKVPSLGSVFGTSNPQPVASQNAGELMPYINAKNGYSFMYPGNLLVVPDKNLPADDGVSINTYDLSDPNNQVSVYRFLVYAANGQTLSSYVNQFLKDKPGPYSEYTKSDIHVTSLTVDGAAAKKVVIDHFGDRNNTTIIILHESKFYVLNGGSDPNSALPTVDKLLTTFKFTK